MANGVALKDLPPGTRKAVMRQTGAKPYTNNQVVKAAGAVVNTLGQQDLPLAGQREALKKAIRWLRGQKD